MEENSVVVNFAGRFERFSENNRGLITDLETVLAGSLEAVEDVLAEAEDALKDTLGSDAANDAGDDADAQEAAITAAEQWVTDAISNGGLRARIAAVLWEEGLEEGEDLLRSKLSADTVSMRLALDVTYALNGEDAKDLLAHLEQMVQRALGEGMLTGSTAAEVEEHSMTVTRTPQPLDEDEVADYMQQRIESGSMALEDIPVRLARYGLMERNAFIEEMRERMGMDEAEQREV